MSKTYTEVLNMKKAICILSCALSLASATAFAASPKAFTKLGDATSKDGRAYSTHHVSCSGKKEAILTYWDDTRLYCIGEAAAEECGKKKIKVAKKACNL